MKILKLKSENVKKLIAVEIEPKGNTVIVTGKNGAGKSSVLDSILYALGGKDTLKDTPKPIRSGEKRAEVELTLGEDQVQYTIKRIFNEYGTTRVEVSGGDGGRYTNPQQVIDTLVGSISFDPLAFANMTEKQQKAQLLDILGLSGKVADIDVKYSKVFEERTFNNRLVKQSEGHLKSMEKPQNAPKSLSDTAEIANRLKDASEHNRLLDEKAARKALLIERISDLNRQLELANDELSDVSDQYNKLGERKDTVVIEKELQNVDSHNSLYRQSQEYLKVENELSTLENKSEEMTQELKQLLKSKDELISGSKLPISGLGVDENGVTFNGIPFSQLSSAEKLKVSLSIAMATNPKLRVMRIMDGSLLDDDNMKVIRELADSEDFQIWIERVDDVDAGEFGFVIEEGQVKS